MTQPLLPYRPCVGIMLLNAENKVWVGQRALTGDEPFGFEKAWQMPQGGIDKGETPLDAAKRELYEETGVQAAELIAEAPDWYAYDFPAGVNKRGYRGQSQRWFAMRFTGTDDDINISAPDGHAAEFDDWRWVEMRETVSLIVPFKRGVYEQVIAAFAHLASATT